MKHAFAWTAALCLSVTPVQTLIAGEPDMTTDERAVLAVIKHMTASLAAGNVPAVMGTYAAGAVVMMEPGQPVTGIAPLSEAFAGIAALAPDFRYSGHEVIVAGDTAVHIAPWQMTATGPDGTALSGGGLSVAILRRQGDGRWKMVIDNPHGDAL